MTVTTVTLVETLNLNPDLIQSRPAVLRLGRDALQGTLGAPAPPRPTYDTLCPECLVCFV